MAKMGRPKKEVIKDKSVTVRLSPETYQKLMSYISATGQTITEVRNYQTINRCRIPSCFNERRA